ncbi:Hypothetical protein CINCED_3A012004 [Cinara cedri]|uniref:Uncharacterized protein n=1 Tax=Cinara cedri TaxID=506608 RepID=A0A5E4MKN1_9HEMI|nr:Hypothetical protein CINCED_3A012004 [Cinara cedri]
MLNQSPGFVFHQKYIQGQVPAMTEVLKQTITNKEQSKALGPKLKSHPNVNRLLVGNRDGTNNKVFGTNKNKRRPIGSPGFDSKIRK